MQPTGIDRSLASVTQAALKPSDSFCRQAVGYSEVIPAEHTVTPTSQ